MSEPDHERIWLEPRPGDPNDGHQWSSADNWSDNPLYANDGPPTEYIRADLVETLCKEIASALAAARAEERERAAEIVLAARMYVGRDTGKRLDTLAARIRSGQ